MLSRPAPGRLYVVATPIGNLEDITLRAMRVLRDARVIAAEDTRRTGKLLAHAGIDTPMLSLHAHNETGRIPGLIERLQRGDHVALVTDAGTPVLSDPGHQLIQAALAAGVRVEPVPGPSAVLAALTMTGVAASQFTFLGFPPARGLIRRRWCEEAATYAHPVVFFEAPHRLRQTMELMREVIGAERRVSLCREITKRHEELVQSTLGSVLEDAALATPIGEFTCILHPPDADGPAPVPDARLAAEFYRMTDAEGLGRREALTAVARRYQVPTREVFAALERRKVARDA